MRRRRSAKGTGCLFRPSGTDTWFFQFTINRRKITLSTKTEDREQAELFRRRYLAEVAKGVPPDAGKVTFAELAEDEIRNYQIKRQKSLSKLMQRLDDHVLPFFGRLRAHDITPVDIQAYIAKRQQKGAANGTINRELTAVKKAFNLGINHGKIVRKPAIDMLPELKKRVTSWREGEIITLLDKWKNPDTKVLIEFLNITGWRKSEGQTLRWSENVDWENRQIILLPGTTKSKEPRVFPFIPDLESLLRSQLAKTKEAERKYGRIIPWVFHRDGKEIRAFNKEWYAAMKAGKFIGKKVHDFRSTAAKRLLRLGFSSYEVCAMVGWKSLDMLKYYAIVETEDLQEKAAKLYQNSADRQKISQG